MLVVATSIIYWTLNFYKNVSRYGVGSQHEFILFAFQLSPDKFPNIFEYVRIYTAYSSH